ncbi:MAG: outer membrane protein assembly factor BamA [Kiritimatiellae bacterium]|nr:outer membrane protein assembly factor BamA [Kiritimatiellia bacterium]
MSEARRIRWLLIGAMVLPVVAGAQLVERVRVESVGAIAADPGTVLSAIETREGQPYDPTRAMRDARSLERTGRFSSVRVFAEPGSRRDAVVVVVEVAVRPVIEHLEITGADEVGNRRVREWLGLGVGDPVDDALLAAGARRVQEEYAKRFYPHARVAWRIEPGRQPGASRVAVTVTEGARARVGAIEFYGPTAIDPGTLRARLKTRAFRWWNPVHWVTGAGRLNDEDLRADRAAIEAAFRDLGYLDVVVRGPAIVPEGRDRVRLKYVVAEGPCYRLGSAVIEGVTRFPTQDVARLVQLTPGAPLAQSALDAAREAIADYYGNRGHVGVQVRPLIEADPTSGVAHVRLSVREGEPARIRDILIRGNVVTREDVIRRELVVAPGEPFHRGRIRTSENRIRNLGYFSHVSLTPQPTDDPAQQDLVVEVVEDRMGTAEAGVAFSSVDRIVGRVELGHGNVDITSWPPFGGGQKARIGAMFGTRRQDYYLQFVEPYLFDRRLRLTLDLYSRESSYFSALYDVSRRGGQVLVEHPLTPFLTLGVGYNLERIAISDVRESASEEIKAEEGARLKSSGELSFAFDTRDRIRLTTRGNYTRLAAELAGGPFGGDTQWYRLDLRSHQYFPIWRGHVLLLRGQLGVMDAIGGEERVPLFDRYFLGGLYTVRAFRYRHIGPADETGEPIGGRSLAFASVEYTVPIYKMVRAAVFVDGGMVWADPYTFDLDWNSGYGLGLRLDIPMLPLRIDYAWQIDSDEYNRDDNGRFNISFGYPF